MRRRLFKLLNVLSSYPVLILLGLLLFWISYSGAGSRAIELEWQSMLSRSIELKEEQAQLDSEIQGLRQSDAYKRSRIYQRQFMATGEVDPETFRSEFLTVFELQGWDLQSVNTSEILTGASKDDDNYVERISAVEVAVVATVSIINPKSDEAFLPFHSIDRIANYLWKKPPIKDIKSLLIERTDTDYKLSIVFLYPLTNSHALSVEPDE